MDFGTIIKKLRHDNDMTQEKLAEYLNISPQAVSRWETETAMPDVSLLPVLANLFNVTTDYLLGVDIANKEKEINEIYEKAKNAENYKNGNRETAAILREGLVKYPNSWILKFNLMEFLFGGNNGAEKEDEFASLREAAAIGKDILNNCTDDHFRFNAMQVLCYIYPQIDMKDKAKAIAEKLPDMFVTKDELQLNLIDGSERIEALKANVLGYAQLLTGNIQKLVFDKNTPFSQMQKIELLKKIIDVYDVLLENNDRETESAGFSNRYIAAHYAHLQDSENTLLYLKAEAEILLQKCGNSFHTPSMLQTEYYINECKKNNGTKSNNYEISDFLEKLKHNRYDFIRNDDKFIAIETELKKLL